MGIFTTSAIHSNTYILDAEKVILSVCVPADPALKSNYIQLNIRIAAGTFGNTGLVEQCKAVVFPYVLIELDKKQQKPGEPFFKTGYFNKNNSWKNYHPGTSGSGKPCFRNFKLGQYIDSECIQNKMTAFSRKVENFSVNECTNEILLFPDATAGELTYNCREGYSADVLLAYNTEWYTKSIGLHFKIQAEIAVLFQSEFSSTKKYESVIA